jgi:hypothetical protein
MVGCGALPTPAQSAIPDRVPAIEAASMEHTGSVHWSFICLALAAAAGLGLVLASQPAKPALWWQARLEQQLARIATLVVVLLSGALAILG